MVESRVKPVALDLPEDFFTTFEFSRGPILGRGMSGEVVLATSSRYPDLKTAVKILTLLTPDEGVRNKRLFATEIAAIKDLSHPHVIKHILSATCPEYLVICTEYCLNGTLSSGLRHLTPQLSTMYFLQIACATRYLNDKQRIVHCDIKPGNIFINAKNDAVLGDFGLSFFILPNDTVVPTGGMGSTRSFVAPEIINCIHVDPYKLDMYSLGVLLWCLLFLREPTSNNFRDCLKNMQLLMAIPQPLRRRLITLLHIDPATRPSATSLLNMLTSVGFFSGFINGL